MKYILILISLLIFISCVTTTDVVTPNVKFQGYYFQKVFYNSYLDTWYNYPYTYCEPVYKIHYTAPYIPYKRKIYIRRSNTTQNNNHQNNKSNENNRTNRTRQNNTSNYVRSSSRTSSSSSRYQRNDIRKTNRSNTKREK